MSAEGLIGALYASISVENGNLCMNCSFRTKRIPLEESSDYTKHLVYEKISRCI